VARTLARRRDGDRDGEGEVSAAVVSGVLMMAVWAWALSTVEIWVVERWTVWVRPVVLRVQFGVVLLVGPGLQGHWLDGLTCSLRRFTNRALLCLSGFPKHGCEGLASFGGFS
jgi:hypothetical protein